MGIEGSDYSFLHQRAEWRVIPDYLFTADATQPFQISSDDRPAQFDVISMWEFLEHIREEQLPQLFTNITNHLAPSGYVVGSIALQDDVVDGISYHPTCKPRHWWKEIMRSHGLQMLDDLSFMQVGDFCRGTGNGPFDHNYAVTPEAGFHFVAQLAS